MSASCAAGRAPGPAAGRLCVGDTWQMPRAGNRRSAREQHEAGLQPIHSFLLRQATPVYVMFVGLALGAVFLSVLFATGVVDVGVPRWLWLLDIFVVVGISVDHARVAMARHRTPTSGVLAAGAILAAVVSGLTLSVCWLTTSL